MSFPQGRLPVLALRNTLVFPGLSQVIKVGRDLSVKALQQAEANGFWIVAVQQKVLNKETSPVEAQDLHSIGTLCRVDSMRGQAESGYQVVLRGFVRSQLDQIEKTDRGFSAEVTHLEDRFEDLNEATQKALLDSLKSLATDILKLIPANTEQLSELIKNVEDLSYLSSLIASHLDIPLQEKQKLLEMTHLRDRSLHLLNLMKDFKEGLEVQIQIRGKLNQKLGENQRQNLLREQLRTIREELGENDNESLESKLKEKIAKAQLPEDVRKVAEQELKRLSDMGPQSPETHIIRNYLELMVSLPWAATPAQQDVDLEEAKAILNAEHFGLEKVKKRILEQLAVMKLKKQTKGSLLLLVGPPGVGKTSLGKSLAKALHRKFVRVSLGGVRDDAEIRGHRRTYIGAMPGRIIQGMKRAEEKNPVFLLDEIDKLSRAFSGDPAAALLEVLDPEQNRHFLDHYLDVPYDLSEVLFIATANQLDSIPGPLLDRMEIIEIPGYTSAEKLHIAKEHLLPEIREEFGMLDSDIEIADEALLRMIQSYTREAGVRDLKRQISALLRGVSERVLRKEKLRIQSQELESILGPEKYQNEVADTIDTPGLALGLAWSPVGGDVLFVEATSMPGKGQLVTTGQLGDVMKESTLIAQSLLRSHASEWGLKGDLAQLDLHVHFPAGAIPKDGPSAGVTLVTALVSLLTSRKSQSRLAMTGEITLRGKVLPVGGIKEKVLAAHRAGVEQVLLPKKNQKDLREVPEEVRNALKFHFVEDISEVLRLALGLEVQRSETQNWIGEEAAQENSKPAINGKGEWQR